MSLTPDGQPQKVLRDPVLISECWIQPNQYPNLVKYAANPLTSGFLNAYIIEACAMVNDLCRRKFNQQQVDHIIINRNLYIGSYETISLNNIPLISVDNVWLNVVDTFAPVSLDYLQVDTDSGVIKILPNFTTYVQTTLPWYSFGDSSNIWIRYTTGYEIDHDNDINNVPLPIQRATAMLVDYLFGVDGIVANVSEFKTQTYSQKTASSGEDPIMSRVKDILKSFTNNSLL